MSVRAFSDLLPGLDSCGLELLLLEVEGKDSQPHGVAQETLEKMIGDRNHKFSVQIPEGRFHQGQRKFRPTLLF